MFTKIYIIIKNLTFQLVATGCEAVHESDTPYVSEDIVRG